MAIKKVSNQEVKTGFNLVTDAEKANILTDAEKANVLTDAEMANLITSAEKANILTDEEIASFEAKAEFKQGTGTFTTGLTHVYTDSFITSITAVVIVATGEPAGIWTVESSTGSFTITSDTAESSVAFTWWATKRGV